MAAALMAAGAGNSPASWWHWGDPIQVPTAIGPSAPPLEDLASKDLEFGYPQAQSTCLVAHMQSAVASMQNLPPHIQQLLGWDMPTALAVATALLEPGTSVTEPKFGGAAGSALVPEQHAATMCQHTATLQHQVQVLDPEAWWQQLQQKWQQQQHWQQHQERQQQQQEQEQEQTRGLAPEQLANEDEQGTAARMDAAPPAAVAAPAPAAVGTAEPELQDADGQRAQQAAHQQPQDVGVPQGIFLLSSEQCKMLLCSSSERSNMDADPRLPLLRELDQPLTAEAAAAAEQEWLVCKEVWANAMKGLSSQPRKKTQKQLRLDTTIKEAHSNMLAFTKAYLRSPVVFNHSTLQQLQTTADFVEQAHGLMMRELAQRARLMRAVLALRSAVLDYGSNVAADGSLQGTAAELLVPGVQDLQQQLAASIPMHVLAVAAVEALQREACLQKLQQP